MCMVEPCWLVTVSVTEYVPGPRDTSALPLMGVVRSVTGRVCCPVCCLLRGDADVEMEYWRVSSLVPGYMTCSQLDSQSTSSGGEGHLWGTG